MMTMKQIRQSKPLVVPPPDIKYSITEEDYAAHKYFYDSVTYAMYNRIRDARNRQREYYYWNNIPYGIESCNTSNETKSNEINRATSSIFMSSRTETSREEEKAENEDDQLQFNIEM